MSFDLYVWHEPKPITPAVADAKLERWADDEPGVFTAHPAVLRFYDELLDRFPALESDEDGVWSATPDRDDMIVAASCVWSRADEVGTAILELAARHGLVCYEPGYAIVNPNAPGYAPQFTLTSDAYPVMPDPDENRLKWIMRYVGTKNRWVTLSRADGPFVQVASEKGAYLLEYREGEHFHCRTTDYHEAQDLLVEFRAGADTFKRRHVWARY
ncbi:hypothetical protein [Actinoplanes flavus]|uniref:Uncharacterized protein n=1 Tax=Actinoplanes flavus TaxID=2820290 RepID=A0ABS3UX25_9ACTN|nr:hypothetical protein [Actinoplanes flavus]MBO3743112.1 hypothetical protein [Actinoplanes flavus]